MVATSKPDTSNTEATRSLENDLSWRVTGEVRFDQYSRMLYSTDASNYQIEPVGVVLPRTIDDVRATIELAAKYDVPILPRGGGSSLAGQTVGKALVIDTSKYLNQILEVDTASRTARVQPGIVLQQLNAKLKRHNLMFGPDPASADRATIGGIVGNNSSGSHSILYGMTADHLQAASTILSDGTEIGFHRTERGRVLRSRRGRHARGEALSRPTRPARALRSGDRT